MIARRRCPMGHRPRRGIMFCCARDGSRAPVTAGPRQNQPARGSTLASAGPRRGRYPREGSGGCGPRSRCRARGSRSPEGRMRAALKAGISPVPEIQPPTGASIRASSPRKFPSASSASRPREVRPRPWAADRNSSDLVAIQRTSRFRCSAAHVAKQLFGIGKPLHPEAAADIGGDDADAVGGQAAAHASGLTWSGAGVWVDW